MLTCDGDVDFSITGRCIVPGRTQSAFRAELGRLYAALHMVLALISQAPSPIQGTVVVNRSILVGCDGKSALERVSKARHVAKGNHFDLVSGIVACRSALAEKGVNLQMVHVKGHQDRIRGGSLTILEALNVMVDDDTQRFNRVCRHDGFLPMDGDVFGEIGPIWINLPYQDRVKIFSDVVNSTHSLFHADMLRVYWKDHACADSELEVDWAVLAKANSQRSVAQHLFHVKQVSGYLGVGKWLHRWKQRTSPECLLCGEAVEDIAHVFRCPDARFDDIWEQEIEKISLWVLDTTQSIRLAEFLRSILWAYRSNGPPEVPLALSLDLANLWEEQLAIGVNSLLNGFFSMRWRNVLEGSTGRSTITSWLSKLTIKIYDMCGYIWGKRNEWVNQTDGGRLQVALQAVDSEIQRGDEGNPRVAALVQEGARPREDSTLGYLQMWLTSVQVAGAANLSQEDRESYSRGVMFRWLRSGTRN